MEQVAVKKLKNPVLDYVAIFLAKFFFSILACLEVYYFSAFLTDTALFSLAIVGFVQLTTTIIDTIFALFYGAMMTNIGKHLPWGETRSWLLIVPPIATVTFCFCLCRVSSSEMVSAIVIIIAFVISHVAWSIGECAMNAQVGIMSDDVGQRAQLSMNIGRGTMASSLVFGPVAGVFLGVFAASPLKFVYMVVIFGVFYWVGYLALFVRSKGCEPTREEYQAMREYQAKVDKLSSRSASIWFAYKSVFTSKNGLVIMISSCIGNLIMFLSSGLMFYYFAYTLEAPYLMGTFMSVRGLLGFLGGIIFSPLVLKWCKGNKKLTMISSSIAATILSLILYFFFKTSVVGYCVISLLQTFFCGAGSLMGVAILSDIGVELTHKTGKELGNYTISMSVLPLKVALVLRSVLVTVALGMTGYVAGQEVTESVKIGFANAYLLWGTLIGFVSLFLTFIYKLPEDKVQAMIVENNAAREADQAKVAAALAEMGENE